MKLMKDTQKMTSVILLLKDEAIKSMALSIR